MRSPFLQRTGPMKEQDFSQILKRQFGPTFTMLQNIVEACPAELWSKGSDERPIWIQVYHVAFGIDVWFGDTKEISYPDFGKKVTPVFEDEQDGVITKQEMLSYLEKISLKTDQYFINHSEKSLIAESVIYEKYTNLDSVLEQMRHIMYHVARINRILKQHGHAPVEYLYYS
jgi:hypothetical protein